MSNFEDVEKWIEKFEPINVENGFIARGDSDFIYENSVQNWDKFSKLDRSKVWTLGWPKEDLILTAGFWAKEFSDGPEIVGYVQTEKSWSSEDLSTILVIERRVDCQNCEGSGENEDSNECSFCEGNGDVTLNFGL